MSEFPRTWCVCGCMSNNTVVACKLCWDALKARLAAAETDLLDIVEHDGDDSQENARKMRKIARDAVEKLRRGGIYNEHGCRCQRSEENGHYAHDCPKYPGICVKHKEDNCGMCSIDPDAKWRKP